MCSIFGIFGLQAGDDATVLRRQALELSQRQRHRGPDWSGVHLDDGAILVHERLAIVDPAGGSQPLRSADGGLVLAVNGEIYNHRELKKELRQPYAFQTGSDCEVINALYREDTPESFLNRLNGIFAFALWDVAARRFLIARDPIGVCPLYWGHDREGRLCVASEMKALADLCADVAQFPPGHYYDSASGELKPYYGKDWRSYDAVQGVEVTREELREAFERAVHRQLMTDVPYGVLLSGGLDSSLVAAVAARFARRRVEDDDTSEAWWPRLHSFAIGLKGSPDLAAAEVAAQALGTVHHGFEYTFEEGLDALPEVIRHIETYDVTTIRASTPMFLLARRIKAMGVKMVLSGEGSDEIFGGYLYFHKAPNAREFHEELCAQAGCALQLRLPARQQVDDGLGRGAARAVPRRRIPRRGDADGRAVQDGRQGPDREGGAARGVRGLPAGFDPVAAEGAVQRWCRLRLDRWPEGACRGPGQRSRTGGGGQALPHQPAPDQGSLLLPQSVRALLPRPSLRRDGAGRQVDCVLLAGGDCLGRQFRGGRRSVRRAVAGVHNAAL